ncbi:MAG: pyridoxamine 5'-phosphate oxidase family protein [Actinomycetota bacterium]|nr:pyridoxamine 5'-phosphate oxidase family protein [Actinomycetota bacterium]
MTPEERKAFLSEHRLAIVGVERDDAPPQLSPVFYVMDGDDLLISTTETRAKTPAVRRAGRVSVCVLGEEMPFPYLTA